MYIKVEVTPESKKEEIEKLAKDRYKITVKTKPEHNLANKKMLELLAAELKIEVKRLRIINGHHTSHKLVAIRELPPEAEKEEQARLAAIEEAEHRKRFGAPPTETDDDTLRHNFHFRV